MLGFAVFKTKEGWVCGFTRFYREEKIVVRILAFVLKEIAGLGL